MKQTIRISEGQLKHIIKESVKRVLRENEQNLNWIKLEDFDILTKMDSMEDDGIADIWTEEKSFDGERYAEILLMCKPLFDETEIPEIKIDVTVYPEDTFEDNVFAVDEISVGSSNTYVDYSVFEKQFPRICFYIEEYVRKLRYPEYDDFNSVDLDPYYRPKPNYKGEY